MGPAQSLRPQGHDPDFPLARAVAVGELVYRLPDLELLDQGLGAHEGPIRQEHLGIGMDALHRGQVEHARSHEHLGDFDPLRKDLVELEERALEAVDGPLDLGEGDEREPVPLKDGHPAVGHGALPRVRDDRLVLDRVQSLPLVPVLEKRPDDALELPGLGRAGREVLGPGQVQLEEELTVPREDPVVFPEPHEAAVVGHHRVGTRPEDGDARRTHSRSS